MRRIQSLDLARGSTVLFIPAIHSVMLFSQEQVRTSWLGYPLRFIAEGAGAQVLMMVMGILFTLKPKYSAKAVCLRALALLFAGYLLNVIKFAIPYATGILPEEILIELQINQEKNVLLQLTAMGDILHFAAIAISLLFIIYQCEYYRIWSFALALIIIVGGPLLYDSESSNPSINYLFQFFTGQPPRVFFPVFPWLVYPLIGLSIGYYWQHHARWVYTYCLHIAWGCVAVGMITSWCFPQNNPSGFYRTYPAATCIHVSIVLFWLGGVAMGP